MVRRKNREYRLLRQIRIVSRACAQKDLQCGGGCVILYTDASRSFAVCAKTGGRPDSRATPKDAQRRPKTPGAMPERAHGVARPSRARGGCDAGQHAAAMSEGRAGARTYGQDRDRRVPTGGGCFFRQMMITARARHAVSLIQTTEKECRFPAYSIWISYT